MTTWKIVGVCRCLARSLGGGGGIGVLVIALLGLFFGFDPGAIFQGGSSVQAPPGSVPDRREANRLHPRLTTT